nr:hypothetical protein [Pseudonocardia ammonioxydans]
MSGCPRPQKNPTDHQHRDGQQYDVVGQGQQRHRDAGGERGRHEECPPGQPAQQQGHRRARDHRGDRARRQQQGDGPDSESGLLAEHREIGHEQIHPGEDGQAGVDGGLHPRGVEDGERGLFGPDRLGRADPAPADRGETEGERYRRGGESRHHQQRRCGRDLPGLDAPIGERRDGPGEREADELADRDPEREVAEPVVDRAGWRPQGDQALTRHGVQHLPEPEHGAGDDQNGEGGAERGGQDRDDGQRQTEPHDQHTAAAVDCAPDP